MHASGMRSRFMQDKELPNPVHDRCVMLGKKIPGQFAVAVEETVDPVPPDLVQLSVDGRL
jgi:hypothetical protein